MNGSAKLLLDTDILSFYFRKSPKVVTEVQKYLASNNVLTVSIITRFEILRGMKVKNAISQLNFFNLFCLNNEIIELTDNIIVQAADIYADLYKRGNIISDADILIAATAIENNLAIVTNNNTFANFKFSLKMANSRLYIVCIQNDNHKM